MTPCKLTNGLAQGALLCLFVAAVVSMAQGLPTPTQDQLNWQRNHTACFIHWNMATQAHQQGCQCGQTAPPISDWNVTNLDTDEWIRTGISMGCSRFVLTAKHSCGFLLWNSSSDYNYTVAYAANTTSVVDSFVASAKRHGVGYGFYYSVMNNAFLSVCNGVIKPGAPVTQQQYNDLVVQHLSELWSRYGPLAEVWFDGGYNPSLTTQLQHLFATLQPHVVAFQAEGLMPSPVRWVGTESGYAPYPCWSTADYNGSHSGSPDSDKWFPAETDFTLQNGDHWFYDPIVGVRSSSELRDMWETSVGHNTAVIIDLAPFPNGTLAQAQKDAANTLGTFVKQCYDNPIAQTSGQGQTSLSLKLPANASVDRIVVEEDQSKGQLVRSFSVTDDSGTTVANGTSVGNKFIAVLPKQLTHLSTLTLHITEIAAGSPAGAPFVSSFAAFSCNALAESLDAAWKRLGH